MDEAVNFDLAQQRVNFKTGAELEYDYLIVATGSTHSYFGKDEWAKLAPGLKTVEDATEIRRRVLLAFELAERQMQETGSHPSLSFVIIGGGPTGVELAGAISDIAKLYMAKDFRHIDPRMAQVLILEGSPHILAAYPEDLQAKAVEQLTRLGIKVRTGAHVPMSSRATSWWATSASTQSSHCGQLEYRLRRWASCSAFRRTREAACWWMSTSTRRDIRRSLSAATLPMWKRTAGRFPA